MVGALAGKASSSGMPFPTKAFSNIDKHSTTMFLLGCEHVSSNRLVQDLFNIRLDVLDFEPAYMVGAPKFERFNTT